MNGSCSLCIVIHHYLCVFHYCMEEMLVFLLVLLVVGVNGTFCGYQGECGPGADCSCLPLWTSCVSEQCELTAPGVLVITAQAFFAAALLLCCFCGLCCCQRPQWCCCWGTGTQQQPQPIVYNQHLDI